MVVLDVDGTLLENRSPVSARDFEAVQRALAAGIVITLATGRMFPLVEPLVRQLGLTAPTICYGGALIVDPVSVSPLYQCGVPRSLAVEVIRVARDRNLTARVYLGDSVYVE